MSTLNVSALKNIGAGFTNLLLNSDGSVTLPVYTNASTPPVQFQAGTLWFNGTNLQIRNSANTAWVAVGGGGSGTVTAVTASLPLASSGGAAPNLTLNLGLGTAVNGSNIAVSIPVASTPPAVGTGAAQALNGSMYWDDTLGQLFIRYINGGTPVWVAAAPPAGGSVSAATLAEAAAGTGNTKFLSPETGVPKNAAGMTGAALLPTGTLAQRPAAPVTGMTRVSSTTNTAEVYTNSSWQAIQSTSSGQFAGLRNIIINGWVNTAFEINQRVVTYAAAAVGGYFADRWKKTAGGMTQIIESGFFVPSSVYTLSGVGVTTTQITSPAAGNWTLPDIPSTASYIQLEYGYVATPFELRNPGLELLLCQRYYEKSYPMSVSPGTAGSEYGNSFIGLSVASSLVIGQGVFQIVKRVTPTIVVYSTTSGIAGNVYCDSASVDRTFTVNVPYTTGFAGLTKVGAADLNPAIPQSWSAAWTADAEL